MQIMTGPGNVALLGLERPLPPVKVVQTMLAVATMAARRAIRGRDAARVEWRFLSTSVPSNRSHVAEP